MIFLETIILTYDRMLKKVLFGTAEGHNYRGQSKKRWVDVLKWCNMTLQQASHGAQDRVEWRTFIAAVTTVIEPRDKKEKKNLNPNFNPNSNPSRKP